MGALLVIAGIIAYLVGVVMLRGWVMSILWAWFITPFGLPAIGIAWAIGLSAVATMFTANLADTSDKDGDTGSKLLQPIVFSLLALFMGWIAHTFMI